VERTKHPGSFRRSRQQDRGPRTEYLAFTLGGDVYAAPVALIREILKPPPLTPVPRAPHQIIGIVSVRGQLVTVVDLRRRLRLTEAPPSRKSRILLVDATGGEVMGVLVDEVLQVYRLAEGEIETAASALGGEVVGYISGIARPSLGAIGTSSSRTVEVAAASGAGAPGGAAGPDASVVILLDLRAVLAS
jgi:purine-binding chemotaxis protein CheW